MAENITYPTKIDRWLVGVICFGEIIPLSLAFWCVAKGMPEANQAVLACLFFNAVFTSVVVAFGIPTRYTFQEKDLEVRAGVIRWNIPYTSMKRAAYSNNFIVGSAWSVDRIHIDYTNARAHAFVSISPKGREAFMAELLKRAPQLA